MRKLAELDCHVTRGIWPRHKMLPALPKSFQGIIFHFTLPLAYFVFQNMQRNVIIIIIFKLLTCLITSPHQRFSLVFPN